MTTSKVEATAGSPPGTLSVAGRPPPAITRPAPGGSMRPSVNSVHLPAAVDVEGGAGDVLGTVGGEEADHLAEGGGRLEAWRGEAGGEIVPALLDRLALHGRELLDHSRVQRGLDDAGAPVVGGDAVGRQLVREALGHADDSELRGGVRHDHGEARLADDRGDVDDAARLLRDEVWYHRSEERRV